MKLRNKKTGEIGNLVLNINPNRESFAVLSIENGDTLCGNLVIGDYDTLAELNAEWEDYEEPKGSALNLMILTLINFIENEPDEDKVDLEDCKQMLEKLKAWKRLKEKGFRFSDWNCALRELYLDVPDTIYDRPDMFGELISEETTKDLDLLFGGEE